MTIPKFESYEIKEGKNKDYWFKTKSDSIYVIYSVSGSRLIPNLKFSHKIKYIGFKVLKGVDSPIAVRVRNYYDKKIMNTVFNFILDIFKDKNAVIIYNYSSEDGKRISRNRLFNIFFLRHNKNIFHKIDFELIGKGQFSILFRRDNANLKSIISLGT